MRFDFSLRSLECSCCSLRSVCPLATLGCSHAVWFLAAVAGVFMLLAMLGLPPRYARVQPCGLISRCSRWSVRVARYARLPRSLRSRVSIRIDFSLRSLECSCCSLWSTSPLATLAGFHPDWFLAGTMRHLCGYYAIINTQLCHTISASMPATSPLYFSAYFTRQLFQQHPSAPQLLLIISDPLCELRLLNAIAPLHAPSHCNNSASLLFAEIVTKAGR